MKELIILLLGIFVPMLLVAQSDSVHYTLSEDREFIKESDFTGFVFVPLEGKMSTAHYADPIPAGVVNFSIKKAYLIIDERARYTPKGIVEPPTNDKPYRLRIASIDKINYGDIIS